MADNINDNLFQISVKGLCFNDENKVMMLLDEEGYWEPFGGRIQKGENLIECLKRECLEETGLKCTILDERPLIVYSTIDQDGLPRVMVYYKVSVDSLDFKPSDECIDIKFFTLDELRNLRMVSQIVTLVDFLQKQNLLK